VTQPAVVPKVTPPPSDTSSAITTLPADIVFEQARRVVLFAGVSAFVWSFSFTMDAFVLPVFVGITPPWQSVQLDIAGASVMVGVFLFLKFAGSDPHTKAQAGIWLVILNTFFLTLIELSYIEDATEGLGRPSWVAIVILTAAVTMPATPRRMWLGSLVAASMGPVAVTIVYLLGRRVPPLAVTLAYYLPNYVFAAVAALPSAMFQRMGRQIKLARDLGSYELVERLGGGGMGAVYRARHRFLARDAAVKLVRPEALGDTDSAAQAQLRRFEREAQATASLKSEHSIRLFDFGATEDGSFYYVMELLDGWDLQTLVKQFGPLPHERAMYLVRQVCHSLAEAHARGMVHRDVKPANIFLCRMGLEFDFIKVLDFGLVKTRAQDKATDVTETPVTGQQQLIGTPAYMSPEMILGRPDVDRRADVYGIGCVAFYLLTGTHVFDGNHIQVLLDHVHTEPPSPSQRLGANLPAEVDALVLDCLRKNPADRPQDARQLLNRINALNLAGNWSNAAAESWWQDQLPKLAAPLPEEVPSARLS
jgi:tRNA A-37 threonylcarbamoyl transferase component Bud32